MAAIGARDEVEVVHVGGVEHGVDGPHAGRPDGSGREAGVGVGVVRVPGDAVDVGVEEPVLVLTQGVLHRRVGLERVADVEAVEVDGRDGGHLVGDLGLALHDGGEGGDLPLVEAHGIGEGLALGRPDLPVLAHHAGDHGVDGHAGGDHVGGRVEIPLQRGSRDLEPAGGGGIEHVAEDGVGRLIHQPGEGGGDALDGVALGYDEAIGGDPAGGQVVEDLPPPDALPELVGPRLHVSGGAGDAGVDAEEDGGAEDVPGLQRVGHGAERGAGGHDEATRGSIARLAPTAGRAGQGRGRGHDQEQQLSHELLESRYA